MRIHVACNIPIFVLLDEAHFICAFRVSVRDRAWQRGGAEIAICNPGRLIDVVKSGPQTCFANLWLSQKLPNHSLHRSSCDESTRTGWKAATCSAVHTLSRSQMMWLACCTFCPCFFSTWHPCVPGEVLDEADRMFHMGFEYQAFWIFEDAFGLDDCEASCHPCHTNRLNRAKTW